MNNEAPPAALDRLYAKVTRRIVPLMMLGYIAAYLDRVNVGFAAIEMNRDLGFSAAVYGLGSGIFFVSYTLLEVPSNLMLARVGAGLWIARIMLTWGLVSASMAFVRSAWMFYVLRFLLGAAEAGFFPGTIYYLTQWFPARERARAIALFMTGTAVAGVIGGPLSSGLLLLDGVGGLHGWQWLFIVEGLPAVLLAPVVWRRLNEGPATARWLSAAERTWLTETIAAEQLATPSVHVTLGTAFCSGRLWALSAIYFSNVLAIYGVSFWLPQLLQGVGVGSPALVSLVAAVPYAAAAVAMVVVGGHSDRTGERRWHVAGAAMVAACGFALTALAPASPVVSVATLSLAAMGVWGALGPFWALPTAFLTGRAAAGGIALVNSVANVAGFVGPTLMGYMREATGNFTAGLWLLAAALLAGAVIAISIAPPAERRPLET